MVGLSVVLEKNTSGKNKNNPQIISKVNMSKVAVPGRSSPLAGFLDRCFLCRRKLLAGKDIYMYKGDKAFCSVECRCNQILMDEEKINENSNGGYKRENCSFTAIKGPNLAHTSSRHNHKAAGSIKGTNGFVFL